MNKPSILVFDVHNAMHRHFHVGGGLPPGEDETWALYAFLREVLSLQARFQTDRCVFCFDGGDQVRVAHSLTYKWERRDKRRNCTDAEERVHECLLDQIEQLRTYCLPRLGHRNVFRQRGFEADDLIAQVVKDANHRFVIISSDKDLHQLLNGGLVQQWLPRLKGLYAEEDLRLEYVGISPRQWAEALAIAGCKGDGIEGIKKVGLLTAAKYLTGNLSEKTKAHAAIEANAALIRFNLTLTHLPHPRSQPIQLRSDCVTDNKWRRLCEELGFDSLLGSFTHAHP